METKLKRIKARDQTPMCHNVENKSYRIYPKSSKKLYDSRIGVSNRCPLHRVGVLKRNRMPNGNYNLIFLDKIMVTTRKSSRYSSALIKTW